MICQAFYQAFNQASATHLKAAWGVDEMLEDIRVLYKSLGIKGLEKIPGVGEGISEKIAQQLMKL